MSSTENQIHHIFSQSIESLVQNCDQLSPQIDKASQLIANQLLEGNKLFACGNDGGASDAQYLVSRFMNHFDRERPSLPAIYLSADSTIITGIASEQNFNDIFAKQIRALGQGGDILFVVSSSANSSNLIQAIQSAHEKQMFVIVLSGNSKKELRAILNSDDIEISIQQSNKARIKELNLISLHCICELIDQHLFGA